MPKFTSKGFHHVAVRVSDFDASLRFYTEGLGFVRGHAWGEGEWRAIMLDAGNGNWLELFAGRKPEQQPKGMYEHFALSVDNCDAALQCALDAGATLLEAPNEVTVPGDPPQCIRLGFCFGLDGEMIEFFQIM